MEFERYQISDDNMGGPLVQIRNNVTGEEMWTRRSRLRRVDGAWMILTDREYDLLMATRKRQAVKKVKNEIAAQEQNMTKPSKHLTVGTSGGR